MSLYYFIMMFIPGDGVINGGDWFGAAFIRWARVDVLLWRPAISIMMSLFDPSWNQKLSLGTVYFLHWLNWNNIYAMMFNATIVVLFPLQCLYAVWVTLAVFSNDAGPLEDYFGPVIKY